MGRRKKQRGSTPATATLSRHGIVFATHGYDHDPAAESYGLEAAEALGVDAARIFKTLLASVDGDLTVGIVPVLTSLDLKALARTIGARKAVMADPADVERATGYVVGGVSPVGQRRQLRTVLDTSATLYDSILVSGGRRGFDIELAAQDLRYVTDAMIADIARTTTRR